MIFNPVVQSGGEQEAPVISVSSDGLITATAGDKSSTQQLPTQAGGTITPGTSSKTAVASGRYTTGNVAVAGSSNLVPGNIKSGVDIFGVTGTFRGQPSPAQDLFDYILNNGQELDVFDASEVTISTPDNRDVYIAFSSSSQRIEESLVIPVYVGAGEDFYTPITLFAYYHDDQPTYLSILSSADGVLLSTGIGTLDRMRLMSNAGDAASWSIDHIFTLIV